MGNVRDEISKNLLFFRKKRGLTQKQLADFLGVKNSAVSNWEKGVNSIDIETLVKACEVLEISINDIYGRYGSLPSQQIDDETSEAIALFSQLTVFDKGVILGEMKQMLRSDKYQSAAKKNA